MLLKHSIKTALKGLRTNKTRSALTILGIVIGIMAIIIVMSVGEGAYNLILGQIKSLGSRGIYVEAGREPKGMSDFTEIFSDSLKKKDADALMDSAKVPGVSDLTPVVFQTSEVSYGSEAARTNIIGASELLGRLLGISPAQGGFLTEADIREKANVALLGSKIKNKLFGESDAVGESIRIRGRSFRVIGVFAPKGQTGGFNIDEMILVPYTTAQTYLFGINHYNFILVEAESEELIPRIVNDIELTLMENHNITDPEKKDFHITTQAIATERAGAITGILTALLTSVAAISLLVGGIGIMNIMLVSVTERTKEIGLRKALGATEGDILMQFLLEAIFLTVAGGALGIFFGATFSYMVAVILSRMVSLDWGFALPVSAIFLGFAVSAVVGLIFGLYPAKQASKKSPMEALRYE